MKGLITILSFLFISSFFPNPIANSEAFRKPISQKIFLNGSSWKYDVFTSKHKNIPWIQTLSPYFKKDGKLKPTQYPLFWGVDLNKDLNVDKMYEDILMDGWNGNEKRYFGQPQQI